MFIKEDDNQTETRVQINLATPEENCLFSHNKNGTMYIDKKFEHIKFYNNGIHYFFCMIEKEINVLYGHPSEGESEVNAIPETCQKLIFVINYDCTAHSI